MSHNPLLSHVCRTSNFMLQSTVAVLSWQAECPQEEFVSKHAMTNNAVCTYVCRVDATLPATMARFNKLIACRRSLLASEP